MYQVVAKCAKLFLFYILHFNFFIVIPYRWKPCLVIQVTLWQSQIFIRTYTNKLLNYSHIVDSSFKMAGYGKMLLVVTLLGVLKLSHVHASVIGDEALLKCESACSSDFLTCMQGYQCSERQKDADNCGLYCSRWVEACMETCGSRKAPS